MAEGKWQGWVWVKWKPGTPATAWENWKGNPVLKGAWSTQGDWDCALLIDVKTPDDFEKFVWNDVRKNQWVENTHSFWSKQWL